MTRVLLTGGNGFVAAHVLELLLKNGHSVVTTVRTEAKAKLIQDAFPAYSKAQLDFVVVADAANPGAFDAAIVSNPPFEAIIHTASPFKYSVLDIQKELIDPAVIGTTNILWAAKKYAPTVKRIVITSSFAALVNVSKAAWPEHTYSEEDWNPMTMEDALKSPAFGYTASKAFAERAVWDFVEKENPGFDVATILPTLVFGPIVNKLHSLKSLNTSNQNIYSFTQGAAKEVINDFGGFNFVDVRDVAFAHLQAMSLPSRVVGNQRFFVTADEHYNNKKIIEIIAKKFGQEYGSVLPGDDVKGGVYPAGGFADTNNNKSKSALGMKYKTLEESIVDTINSFKAAA